MLVLDTYTAVLDDYALVIIIRMKETLISSTSKNTVGIVVVLAGKVKRVLNDCAQNNERTWVKLCTVRNYHLVPPYAHYVNETVKNQNNIKAPARDIIPKHVNIKPQYNTS